MQVRFNWVVTEVQRLNRSAAEAYVWTSWILWTCGSIPTDVFRERIRFVFEEAGDEGLRTWAFELFREVDGEEGDDIWPRQNDEGETGATMSSGIDEPVDPFFQLILNVAGHGQWDFHQYDADPYPSVPHGHEQSGKRKLDAYLGFMYLRGAECGRVSRVCIVSLWNDAKFRDFAYRAVSWYMAQYPHHKWRVPRPLILPRRR